ncbi:unnamed protein product [Diabrotica balteata]|uniref:Uncharacterized protein n=1 Tax=Diabrotica balteata TaxID=107213 RepID=A0A9N9XAW0_DIABA|nr:unnamed protein product [Diabrotica balteata]
MDIIITIFTLATSALKSSIELHLNQSLKLFNHDTLLLPILLPPLSFPCIISLSSSYRCTLIICPRYCNFLIFILLNISHFLPISRNTSNCFHFYKRISGYFYPSSYFSCLIIIV